jgi:hypothetical protein
MPCNLDHLPPVNHTGFGIQLHEWPDECVWAQLQYERSQQDSNLSYTSTEYLANLEKEWSRRGICSRCHRKVDENLDTQMSALEARAHDATDKLGRIKRLLMSTPDSALRPEIAKILAEQ